jgi:Ca-activated chloride channel homolog
MSFSDIRWLWALVLVPLLLLLELAAARRAERALSRLTGERRDSVLRAQVRTRSRRLGALLRLGALVSLIVGAAGPEWGREVVRRASHGSDVVLVLDVSASMDARDVAPSRLDEARQEALAVLDQLQGSRVGVVAFAGDASRLCPLTLDRGAARLVLGSLTTGSTSLPGTDLGRALGMAVRVMPPGRRDEQAIVLWTDGEDLERGARVALEHVVASGVRVYAVGVGTPAGGEVPVLDDLGRAVDVKRTPGGGPVVSRLDEDLLRAVARRTRGGYFSASRPGGELPRLLASLGGLARSARGTRLSERPVARFRVFALLAALLLAADLLRPRRRREAETEVRAPLHADGGAAVLLAAALLLPAAPARAQSDWARGDGAFRAGRWAVAESLYTRRLARGGPDEVRVNLATARMLAGRQQDEPLALAVLARRPGRAGGTAAYNLGTWRGARGEVDSALAVLRAALRGDPGDEDARWNYELLLRRERERERRHEPKAPKPGQQGGTGSPQASPSAPRPSPSAAPKPGPSRAEPGSMTRTQAERLLDALAGQEQRERGVRRQAQADDSRKGRDW